MAMEQAKNGSKNPKRHKRKDKRSMYKRRNKERDKTPQKQNTPTPLKTPSNTPSQTPTKTPGPQASAKKPATPQPQNRAPGPKTPTKASKPKTPTRTPGQVSDVEKRPFIAVSPPPKTPKEKSSRPMKAQKVAPHYSKLSKKEHPSRYQNLNQIEMKPSDSLLNTHRLKRDGRKTPEQYKQTALNATSPSELSLKSITEYYVIPDANFATADDVFRYRGYKKMEKIDEGAFGIVSKAVRLADNTIVAVKEVDLRRKKAKRIEEMRRELFVLQKVDNNCIVKLIEHFIIGQMLVIVMEYCAGSNLTTYLKENAIGEPEAMRLFKQMANAIKILHRKGIAHRDVKLNNFLLDSTRRLVKIGDFGLSVVSYKQTQGILMAKTYCGTEPYMAPEILKRNSMGVRSYNPLYADIWSLGVCLFAMLTRTFPFSMQVSQVGLLRAQVARKWRFPRSLRDTLSDTIKDLVWHMLDPEPERRISINGVISHPWLCQNLMVILSASEDADSRSVKSPSVLIDAK